jgi:hypothetical protein
MERLPQAEIHEVVSHIFASEALPPLPWIVGTIEAIHSPPRFSAFPLKLIVGSHQHCPLHSRIPLQATSTVLSVAAIIARVIVVIIIIAGVVKGLGIDGRVDGGEPPLEVDLGMEFH